MNITGKLPKELVNNLDNTSLERISELEDIIDRINLHKHKKYDFITALQITADRPGSTVHLLIADHSEVVHLGPRVVFRSFFYNEYSRIFIKNNKDAFNKTFQNHIESALHALIMQI